MGDMTEQKPVGFALGLGLTNECNLSCSFCYRDPNQVNRLSFEQVRGVLDALPVRSVNLGTGENGLHPDFLRFVGELRERPLKLTMTSNGHSVKVTPDDELRAFKDIEFSLDYPTRDEQDAQRGDGNWDLILEQAERCRRLGVPVTIIAVMMRSNYLKLARIAGIAKAFDAPLRVNVYQSVRSDAYALTYNEYWDGFEKLFQETDVIAIGEPLVRAAAGLPPRTGGCGISTVRVTPRATVQPCVYWQGGEAPLETLIEAGPEITKSSNFQDARTVPEACRSCALFETCRGGCAGRRRLQKALREPDFYCPIVRGEKRRLDIRLAPMRDLPKLDSACTTIVIARS